MFQIWRAIVAITRWQFLTAPTRTWPAWPHRPARVRRVGGIGTEGGTGSLQKHRQHGNFEHTVTMTAAPPRPLRCEGKGGNRKTCDHQRERLWLFGRSVRDAMKEVTATFQRHKKREASGRRARARRGCAAQTQARQLRDKEWRSRERTSGWCQQSKGSSPHLESRTPPQKFQRH